MRWWKPKRAPHLPSPVPSLPNGHLLCTWLRCIPKPQSLGRILNVYDSGWLKKSTLRPEEALRLKRLCVELSGCIAAPAAPLNWKTCIKKKKRWWCKCHFNVDWRPLHTRCFFFFPCANSSHNKHLFNFWLGESILSQKTQKKKASLLFFGSRSICLCLSHCKQMHQPIRMVVQNGGVSRLSTEHCFTVQTQILKAIFDLWS